MLRCNALKKLFAIFLVHTYNHTYSTYIYDISDNSDGWKLPKHLAVNISAIDRKLKYYYSVKIKKISQV